MAIEAENLAVQPRASEQIAEEAEALQGWRPDYQRYKGRRKNLLTDIYGATYAAYFRRRIES